MAAVVALGSVDEYVQIPQRGKNNFLACATSPHWNTHTTNSPPLTRETASSDVDVLYLFVHDEPTLRRQRCRKRLVVDEVLVVERLQCVV